jgi:hypothetical protein
VATAAAAGVVVVVGVGGIGAVDRVALRRAVHARAAYFAQHAESLTMKAARRDLEGDLGQGLTLVHFSAQCKKRVVRDGRCIWGLLRGVGE